MSFDFDVYNKEFYRILDHEILPNGKTKPKAIKQLINSIRKILKKEFDPDTDYYYRNIYIYPVLLTHDSQYDSIGFNELLDYWFQKSLIELKKEGLYIQRIKPLSVVNIDSLIYFQEGLNAKFRLHDILNLYHIYKKPNIKSKFKSNKELEVHIEYLKSKLIPFSTFIGNHFLKNNIINPPNIKELILPELFKNKE